MCECQQSFTQKFIPQIVFFVPPLLHVDNMLKESDLHVYQDPILVFDLRINWEATPVLIHLKCIVYYAQNL